MNDEQLDNAIAQKKVHLGRNGDGSAIWSGKFEGLDLSNMDFSGARLECVEFRDCDLHGADFTKAGFDVSCGFYNCNMQDSDFSDVYAQYVSFSGCDLRGAKLYCGDFAVGEFDGCDLRGAYIYHCNFDSTSANGCQFDEGEGISGDPE